MRLNLNSFYGEMKKSDFCLHGFPAEIKGVRFDVLFETHESPFKLIIIQLYSNFELTLDVLRGFTINPLIPKDKYKSLCKILGLKWDPNNPFSPSIFFHELNSQIPNHLPAKRPSETIAHYYKDSIEESDKVYYRGHINWNVVGGGNASEKNLNKTLRLFGPTFYQTCKNNNISIQYTHIQGNRDIREILR